MAPERIYHVLGPVLDFHLRQDAQTTVGPWLGRVFRIGSEARHWIPRKTMN